MNLIEAYNNLSLEQKTDIEERIKHYTLKNKMLSYKDKYTIIGGQAKSMNIETMIKNMGYHITDPPSIEAITNLDSIGLIFDTEKEADMYIARLVALRKKKVQQ